MKPKKARELSIKLCNAVYKRILKIPSRTRPKVSGSSANDILWKPDLVAFSSIKKFLIDAGIPFSLISESGRIQNDDAQIIVVADELEGTRNFKDRNGPFAISIGILKPKINPHVDVLGAAVLVRDSWGVRTYSANNEFAYVGKTRIECFEKRMENCSIAVGDYHTSISHAKMLPFIALYKTKHKEPLNPLIETLTGSYASAVDLCYCSDPKTGVVGYIDLRGLFGKATFPYHGITPLDIIQAAHILECAGGKVTDAFGRQLKYDLEKEPILTMVAACNTQIHRNLIERIREAFELENIPYGVHSRKSYPIVYS